MLRERMSSSFKLKTSSHSQESVECFAHFILLVVDSAEVVIKRGYGGSLDTAGLRSKSN